MLSISFSVINKLPTVYSLSFSFSEFYFLFYLFLVQ